MARGRKVRTEILSDLAAKYDRDPRSIERYIKKARGRISKDHPYWLADEMKESLRNYLQSILNRYRRVNTPWEDETDATKISEIAQPKLIEERKRSETEPQPKTYDIETELEELADTSLSLDEAIKENPRLIITGNPGTGKSTCLKWIAYTYAEQISASSRTDLPLPIYVELIWYKNGLNNLITSALRENGLAYDTNAIEELCKRGGLLFLLDGLDDISDRSDCINCIKDIRFLTSLSSENRFVVTSRRLAAVNDLKNLQFRESEISELSFSQVKLLLEKSLGTDKGDRLLKQLKDHGLLNEAKNPLILRLLILEFRENEHSQIPLNRGKLFKRVLEERFLGEWERKAIPPELPSDTYTDLKIEALSKLAFYMIDNKDSMTVEESDAKEILDQLLKEGRQDYKSLRDEILRQLLKHNILVKHESKLSFWHRSFRDYFAAVELSILFSKRPKEFTKRYTSDRWQGAILFLVGIMEEPSTFVEALLKPLWWYFLTDLSRFPSRLSLAAACVGANDTVQNSTQQKVVSKLTEIIKIANTGKGIWKTLFWNLLDVQEAIAALGNTRSKIAVPCLRRISNGNIRLPGYAPEYIRPEAVTALGNIPSSEAQLSLVEVALWDNNFSIGHGAALILQENLLDETASKLIQVLCSDKEVSAVQEQAIFIIRGTYPQIAIDPLLQIALEGENQSLRSSAAGALRFYAAEHDKERIVDFLVHNLGRSPNPKIRVRAGYALLYQFSEKAEYGYIDALDDENSEVRASAAYYLGFGYSSKPEIQKEAAEKLVHLFYDTDIDVRVNAIRTFGVRREDPSDEELVLLADLLGNSEIFVRGRAAEALGRFKAKNYLEKLKEMVKDEKYVYPWAKTIRAISQIEPGFTATIMEQGWENPYIAQLDSEDIEERRMAAEVLRDIGTEIALPYLKKAQEDLEKNRSISGELLYAINDIEKRIS